MMPRDKIDQDVWLLLACSTAAERSVHLNVPTGRLAVAANDVGFRRLCLPAHQTVSVCVC